MKRLALALLVVVATLVLPSTSLAQQAPVFNLGFKALADQVPDVVGIPLENERFNVANGNSEQRTTKGLMVWRKADNWTAFTNGYMTWINGPYGVQSRLNTLRFPWEKDPVSLVSAQQVPPGPTPTSPPTPPCVIPGDAAKLKFSIGGDGAWWGSGTVRNTCSRTMDVEINVVGSKDSGAVSPLIDAPTIFLSDVPAGVTKEITVRVPYSDSVPWFSWTVSSWASAERQNFSMNVGTTKPLTMDPWLLGTVSRLWSQEDGQWLLKVAAQNGVRVRRDKTDVGVLGVYSPGTKTVTIDERLDAYSSWIRAAVLAHELQHAADDAAGKLARTSSGCYLNEEEAFRREAEMWTRFWGSKLPLEVDSVHHELNDISLTVYRDPVGFTIALENEYSGECSQLPGQ